jgi:hypothetical protein
MSIFSRIRNAIFGDDDKVAAPPLTIRPRLANLHPH